jgi:hypothetical protein
VECSNGQIPTRLLALAIAVILAAALLLGLATPANAESTSAVGAVAGLATEGSTQGPEVGPSPAPAERESSAEAPAAAPTSGDGGNVQGESVAPAPAPEPNPPPQPVAYTASQASELVGTVRRDAAEAAAPVAESGDSVAPLADEGKSVEHVLGSAQHSLQKTAATVAETGKTLSSTIAPLSGAVAPVPAVSDLIAPASVEDSPGSAGVAAGPLSPRPAEGSPGSLLDGASPGGRVATLDDLFLAHFAGPGGIEPFRFLASASSGDAVAGGVLVPVMADATGAFSGGGVAASPQVAVPQTGGGPLKPPSELSQAVASGLGGSSFVPIVALLALLALVAPTIFRRLREMPDLLAPIPFVCALERPG